MKLYLSFQNLDAELAQMAQRPTRIPRALEIIEFSCAGTEFTIREFIGRLSLRTCLRLASQMNRSHRLYRALSDRGYKPHGDVRRGVILPIFKPHADASLVWHSHVFIPQVDGRDSEEFYPMASPGYVDKENNRIVFEQLYGHDGTFKEFDTAVVRGTRVGLSRWVSIWG